MSYYNSISVETHTSKKGGTAKQEGISFDALQKERHQASGTGRKSAVEHGWMEREVESDDEE